MLRNHAFCTTSFGTRLEHIARRAGYSEWATVAASSSGTTIWAQNGIESVNLSAGYQNEHSSYEQLDVEACYGMYKFLMEMLNSLCVPVQQTIVKF